MIIRNTSLLLALLLAGCSSDPRPDAQMQLSVRTVDQARSVGASGGSFERAENALRQAREELAAGHNHEASLLAEQAELDARLAEVEALVSRTQAEQASLRQNIHQLRQQLGALR